MGTLASYSRVSTIVWPHPLNFNETLGEKARWDKHKDAACYFEHILDAESYKMLVVLGNFETLH